MMWTTHMLGGATAWLGACVRLPVPPSAVWGGLPVAAVSALWTDIDSEQSTAARAFAPMLRGAARSVRQFRPRRQTGWAVVGVVAVDVVAGLLEVLAWLARVVISPLTYRLAVWVKRRYKHRGPVHSLFFGVPLCAALAGLCGLVGGLMAAARPDVSVGVLWPVVAVCAAAGFVGAVSHPLLDLPTYGCGACSERGRRQGLTCKGHPNPGCALLWPFVRGRVGVAAILVGGKVEIQLVRPALVGLAILGGVFTVMG